MGCEKCNRCQASCTSCEGCNKCQTCDSCQTICQKGCQTYANVNNSSFSWNHCVKSNEIISPNHFNKSDWQKLVDYINNARNSGTKSSTGGTLANPETKNLDPISAAEFNRVANKVGGITKDDNTPIKSGDVIYGKYFTSLASSASTQKISSSACNYNCNSCESCDTGCNTTCTRCQGCNGSTEKQECTDDSSSS